MATEQPRASQSEQAAPPSNTPEFPYKELFADIQQEWDKAESSIKRSEQVAVDIAIPAISELRYGGRRLVDALNVAAAGGEEASVRALLEDARFCCHRARHDAVDAALAKIAIDIDNLTSRLTFEAVSASCSEFHKFYSDFAAARSRIAQSREKRDDRNTIYETIATVDLPDLVERYQAVMACAPIAKELAAKTKIQSFGFWLTIALGLVGAFFAGTAVDWAKLGLS